MELTPKQTRQLIDTEQAFQSWRNARDEFEHGYEGSYAGKMKWRKRSSGEYLYRIRKDGRELVLGRRSPETEAIKEAYTRQRTRLRERLRRGKARLVEMARMNRALRLGRLPRMAAAVIDRLDAEGLLGEHLIVVGTHALYAYESAAAVQIDSGLLATRDVDLLWDARNRVRLAALDVPAEDVLALLRDIDASFERQRRSFTAQNADGFEVDVIRPLATDEAASQLKGLGNDADVAAAAIQGLQWLVNAPKFERVVIDDRGQPVRMVTIDPRVFALHKWWLANEAPDRDPGKRRRDRPQALVAARIAQDYLRLPFQARELSALPLNTAQQAKDLIREAKSATS